MKCLLMSRFLDRKNEFDPGSTVCGKCVQFSGRKRIYYGWFLQGGAGCATQLFDGGEQGEGRTPISSQMLMLFHDA